MTTRLPRPPSVYSSEWANQLCAAIDRAFSDARGTGQASTFGDLTLTGDLTVQRNAAIVDDLAVGGTLDVAGATTLTDLAFSGVLTLPTPTFIVNGVLNRADAFRLVGADAISPKQVWATDPAVASAPDWRVLSMEHLPDYVPQGAPDATVTTVANTAAVNQPLGTPLAIAANSLSVGDRLRMTCRGVYSGALSVPTLTLSVRTASGSTLATTGANALGAAGLTNRGWEIVVDIVVTALGNALVGKMEVQGRAVLSTTAVAAQIVDMESAAVVGFDTTSAQSIQLCATWSAASVSNSISCRQTIWEIMKS